MSKKFGINSKAAEARARQDAVKQTNDREKQQRLEDEYWKDDDKQVQKKQQRKDDREKKDTEKLQRKQENQKQLEEEQAALAAAKSKKTVDLAPKKVTQAQIQQRQTPHVSNASLPAVKQRIVNEDDFDLEENINHLQIDGASARNVEQAISVLQSSDNASIDSHPEKRMKAAYQTYEDENLPKLKQEHPSLRLSQLKQLLKKEWMKSPDNPFNKPNKPFNLSLQKTLDDDDDEDKDEQ